MIQLNPECRLDLEWWIEVDRLQSGFSLAQVNPHLDFWSDSSDMGWGAHLQDVTASGRWSQEEAIVDHPQGVACIGVRSSRIPTPSVQLYGGSLCGQFHSSSLSPQTRGHKVSSPQLYCAEGFCLHWQVWRFSSLLH